MNWIIELWGAVTPDAHLSAFVAVFVVIATAVTAEFCKIVVHITALFFLPFDRFQRSRRLGSAIHLQWRLSA